MVEIIIVIRFTHGREINHFGQTLLELVGVVMNRSERAVTRLHEVIVLVRSKIHVERHHAVVQKRIDRARRLDRKLRVKFHWILQITQALLQQRRHLL